MKITVPGSIGGMNVAMAWPNMWLRGRRFRNLNGKKGLPHFLYFRISRSTGTMFARTLRCVMTTPFGSAVAPDVKMISATSSRVIGSGGGSPARVSKDHSSSCSFSTGAATCDVNGGTSCPPRTSASRTAPPMYPVAPVRKIRIAAVYHSSTLPRDTLIDFFRDLERARGCFLIYDDGFRCRSHTYADVAQAARGFAARVHALG